MVLLSRVRAANETACLLADSNAAVSRVAVVAVVSRVRVHPWVELVQGVGLVRADGVVVPHLLRLGVDARVNNVGGVVCVRACGVRCWAGGAVVFSCAVRAGHVRVAVGVASSQVVCGRARRVAKARRV